MDIDYEAECLEDALNNGEISDDEYDEQMYELESEYRARAENAAIGAYEREMGGW